MIGSRAVGLLRNISRSKAPLNLQQLRNSHDGEWSYRSISPPPKWATRSTTAVAVFTWWWFYWNLYHGWPHLIGLYDGEFLKDPRTYTDEELGIPPDDYEE